MRKSEIFDNFVKIAEEQDLIPLDAPKKAKDKLEKNPRWDSLDISAIEALYGVKNNKEKDQEYDQNIVERAHPGLAVVSPAHDKLNGLVPNNNQRQAIILNKLNKTPDGQINNKKYAEKELILSLVKIANDLDSKNEDELRTLADTCIQQFAKKKDYNLKKQAIAWIPIIIGVSAIVGALAANKHLRNFKKGFAQDHSRLITAIDDLLTQEKHWYGVGYEIDSTLKDDLISLKDQLNAFYPIFISTQSVLDGLQKIKSPEDLVAAGKDGDNQKVQDSIKDLTKATQDLEKVFKQIYSNFSQDNYKLNHVKDKGIFSEIAGYTQLSKDPFDDITTAMETYETDIADVFEALNIGKTQAHAASKRLSEAVQKTEELSHTGVEAPKEKSTFFGGDAESSLDQETSDFEKSLMGL